MCLSSAFTSPYVRRGRLTRRDRLLDAGLDGLPDSHGVDLVLHSPRRFDRARPGRHGHFGGDDGGFLLYCSEHRSDGGGCGHVCAMRCGLGGVIREERIQEGGAKNTGWQGDTGGLLEPDDTGTDDVTGDDRCLIDGRHRERPIKSTAAPCSRKRSGAARQNDTACPSV